MADSDGADVIVLTANITMDRGFAEIKSKIEINGNATNKYTIDGGNSHSGFQTNVRSEGGDFIEADLTLKNLKLTKMRSAGSGGAIDHLRGKLTLDNVEISESSASGGGAIRCRPTSANGAK